MEALTDWSKKVLIHNQNQSNYKFPKGLHRKTIMHATPSCMIHHHTCYTMICYTIIVYYMLHHHMSHHHAWYTIIHATPWYATPSYTTPSSYTTCYTIVCYTIMHATPSYATPSCATSSYVTPSYAECYTITCYTIIDLHEISTARNFGCVEAQGSPPNVKAVAGTEQNTLPTQAFSTTLCDEFEMHLVLFWKPVKSRG